MRCYNCGSESPDRAIFCERCGSRLVLPPVEAQPVVLNTELRTLLRTVPRVALVPILGLVIGAFAFFFYIAGIVASANAFDDPSYDPFSADWSSGPEAFFVVSVVLGVISAFVFWGGIVLLILRSD